MTHAFFKALLFLTAGAVILACHHEQDIFKMGGLRKQLPLEYACFLVGGLALSAFPWLTAGYYSKDEILWEAYASGHSGLFLAGLVGAFLTPLYTFRLIFTVFHGEAKMQAHRGQRRHLLAAARGAAGVLDLHRRHDPSAARRRASGGGRVRRPRRTEARGGDAVEHRRAERPRRGLRPLPRASDACSAGLPGRCPARLLARWWIQGWGFDWLYDRLLVRPFVWFARVNIRDGIDLAILTIPAALRALNGALVRTETGRIRWYAAGMAAGAVLVIAMVFV